MKLNFKWFTKAGEYQSGENLYVGNKILVGSYEWHATFPKGQEHAKYVGFSILPGIAHTKLYGVSPEEIKPKIEDLIIRWFEEALRAEA